MLAKHTQAYQLGTKTYHSYHAYPFIPRIPLIHYTYVYRVFGRVREKQKICIIMLAGRPGEGGSYMHTLHTRWKI